MKINVSRDLTPCLVQFLCRKIRDTAGYVGRLQGKRPFRSGGRGGEIEHLNHSWAMKMKTVGSKFAYCDSDIFGQGTSNYGTYIQIAIFWASKPCSLIAETCSRCLQSQSD